MLQVEPIEQVCEDILTEHYISPETCLGTWALADKVSCQDLLMKAKIHALKNFEEVCMNEEFLELSVEFLKTYISDEGLHAKKEERVLEAIMLWARHDLKGRQSHLKELLECVRFSRVDQDYLKDIVEKDKVLAEVPGVKELIKDQSTCVRPRHIQQEEILILAGLTLLGQRVTFNNNMYRLDLHGDCIDMTPLPESLRETATGAVCVVNNDVIVTGGYSSRFEAWVYKPSLDSWSQLCYLKRGRFNHGMAVLQGKVYVVGGDHPDLYTQCMCKSLPEVEVYSEVTNSWELVAPLKQGVCHFAIATCCEKIYVFGGRMCRKEETAVVQCYDPTQNVWTFAKPLPKSMTGIQACTVNSKIYLVGGQLDHVLCYDPQEDCYEEMADRLCPWGTSSATVCGSEIYITGGFEKDPTRHEFCRDVPVATVQCYNVRSDIVVMVKDLPLRLRYHNIVTITKP